MRHPISAYNEQGDLKAPMWLYLLLAFLGRTWLLFVIAAASRGVGSDLLALFYPNHYYFYLGLASATPTIALLLVGRLKTSKKHKTPRPWAQRLWQYGPGIIGINLAVDVSLQLMALSHQLQDLSLYQLLPLLLSFWLGWYLLKSRRLSDYFQGKHILHDALKGQKA